MWNEKRDHKVENKENNPIGVFDSGIGGATVLKEIIKIIIRANNY